jgi:hypothetical protein
LNYEAEAPCERVRGKEQAKKYMKNNRAFGIVIDIPKKYITSQDLAEILLTLYLLKLFQQLKKFLRSGKGLRVAHIIRTLYSSRINYGVG